jgi:AraC-like DNA-binding protein
MAIEFEERPSDSPLVEAVWRAHSEASGSFLSTASAEWEVVVSRYGRDLSFTVRGPETRPSPAEYPAEAEWLGIRFKLGAFMPSLPPAIVADRGDRTLPAARERAFWLDGAAWEFPTFDNADSFIERLRREGILAWDTVVQETLAGRQTDISPRAVQARFRRATGLTEGLVRQIERAHHAVSLLEQGTAISDTVYEAGYFDQPHLTRSLRRFIGRTPGEIARRDGVVPSGGFAFVQDAASHARV